jgi:hypothetical protein
MTEVKVRKKWSSYFERLDEDSAALLEESILKHGQREAIVTDAKGNVLDGHNRLEILARHNIPPRVTILEDIKTDADAEEWILLTQLGRRNLGNAFRTYARGKLVAIKTAKAPKGQAGRPKDNGADYQKEKSGYAKAIDELATLQQVTKRTLTEDRAIAAAVDQLSQPAKRAYLSGARKLSAAAVAAVAELPAGEQVGALQGSRTKPEPAPVEAGSREDWQRMTVELHQGGARWLAQLKTNLRQANAEPHSAGYLTGAASRIEELIVSLRSYLTEGQPVEWTGERWTTKLEEKQRAKPKRK